MMRGQFRSMFNRMRDIYLNRLTADRAGKLDFLDAPVSSRQAGDIAQQQYEEMLRQILMAGGFRCEIYTSPGTYSFRVPIGVTCVLCSGCGSGAGVITNNSYSAYGGGAPSLIRVPLKVTPGEIIQVVVREPGTNKTQNQNGTSYGNNGNPTTIGSLNIPGAFAGSVYYYSSGGVTINGGRGGCMAGGNTTDYRCQGTAQIADASRFSGSPFVFDGTASNSAYSTGVSALDWLNGAGSTGKPGAAQLEWWGAAA